MSKTQKIALFSLRVGLGWFMFYAGLVKIANPHWSAQSYLLSASTFSGFYAYLAQQPLLGVVNVVNEWALTLLGVSLMLGVCVKLSSRLGIVLMFLYYGAVLHFPFVGAREFLIDDHIIYILILAYFAVSDPAKLWGLQSWLSRKKFLAKYPLLRSWLS